MECGWHAHNAIVFNENVKCQAITVRKLHWLKTHFRSAKTTLTHIWVLHGIAKTVIWIYPNDQINWVQKITQNTSTINVKYRLNGAKCLIAVQFVFTENSAEASRIFD